MYNEYSATTLNECPNCNKPIRVQSKKYHEKDIEHGVSCPWCKKTIVTVSKGTRDILIFKN